MTTALNLRESVAPDLPPLIGNSPAIRLARSRTERFAKSTLPVLIVGPTGTGKELVARHLHAHSGRRGELVDVNCGALPRDMIESLLFGHRKGAFTGATETTTGLVVEADRGTLFLDELSSLPPEGQAKLLRVVETNEVLPLGANTKRRVDFRLVAAVQEDINSRVRDGLFRRDLFHRIEALRIELPPLAVRREDIPLLARHFAAAHGCSVAEDALGILQARPWPGNVRELRAVIDRAALLTSGCRLEVSLLLDGMDTSAERDLSIRSSLLQVCLAHSGRADAIAAVLGVSRATLFRHLRIFGISLKRLKVSPES